MPAFGGRYRIRTCDTLRYDGLANRSFQPLTQSSMVRPQGLEPWTPWLKIKCCYHLSYRCIFGAAGRICTLYLNVRSVTLCLSELQRYWRIGHELHVLTTGLRPVPRLTRILPIIGALTRIRTLITRLEGACPLRWTIRAWRKIRDSNSYAVSDY